jgi:AraC family transcriptional regulator of adaptative response / DNA-3-methyladenine glycosylase II
MRLTDPADAPLVVAACRRLLGLDADPAVVDAALGSDPDLAPLVAARPGRRLPVHVDPAELAVRAVLGQQVTLAAARGLAGRLVELCGEPVDDALLADGTPRGDPAHRYEPPSTGTADDPTGDPGGDGDPAGAGAAGDPAGAGDPRHDTSAAAPGGPPGPALTTVFPSPAAVAEADLDQLGMPGARRATLRTLARALAEGDIVLDPEGDHDETEQRLLALRGIGPWTAAYVRMRALGDPDVFLAGDAGVRNALAALGVSGPPPDERWRPWRSYAVQHLWASLG